MRKLLFIIALAIILPVSSVNAHSGRTDSNGGHNCNVGACAGTYHYHNGGSAPAPSTPKYTPPPPRTPVVTTKLITEDMITNFNEKTEYTSKKYFGYSKVNREGSKGLSRATTEITYTDGKETGRALPTITVVTQPIDKITKKGKRIAPKAEFTSIEKTNKKDKYDIHGKYKANAEVVLSLDGKKIKRAKTDKDGKFVFKSIKIKAENAEFIAFKRVKGKENQVSEKTFADIRKQKLRTEYAKLNNKD